MMNTITKEERQRIIDALDSKGPMLACPRCGHGEATLVQAYSNTGMISQMNKPMIGEGSVTAIVTCCDNCGFLSHHSVNVLGLREESLGD